MSWFGWLRKSDGADAGGEAARPARSQVPRPATPAAAPPEPLPMSAARLATPHEVRRLLFDAVATGDDQRLEALCREHKDFIVTHLPAWLEVPPAFRARPEVYEWYGKGLREVTKFCAEKLNDANLHHRLNDTVSRPDHL